MDYTIETFEGCTIEGLKKRTDNSRAMQVIPGLWETFFKDNTLSRISEPVAEPYVYGVYTAYESDEHGEYDFVLGGRSKGSGASPGLELVGIPNGNYAVFTAPGTDQVIAAWQKIWQTKLKRTYVSDFECYDQKTGQVKIYVGVC